MFNITRIACPSKYQLRRKYREYSNLRAFKAPLHLSRDLYKSTIFLQNKPDFKTAPIYISAYNTSGYGSLQLVSRRKNKAKQSQNKPNFEPKLASFWQYWLCLDGGAGRCRNCRNGSEMRVLADEDNIGWIYKTIPVKQLAEGRLIKKHWHKICTSADGYCTGFIL